VAVSLANNASDVRFDENRLHARQQPIDATGNDARPARAFGAFNVESLDVG
jgi:hypothetical protein